jgi:N-acetylmuramoyl-L-alanine amidase CwlA
MAYPIIQKVTSNNRTHKVLVPLGVLVHETATPGATDEAESIYFDKTTRKAMVHFFVDWDSITQKVSIYEQVWAAGPTANKKYIHVELCHAVTKTQFDEVWKRGTWLFAYLFVNYLHYPKVTAQNLPSHHDVTKLWKETDHTDPDGYFAEFGKTVADFRNDVQKEIDKMLAPKPVELIVIASSLMCRESPDLNGKVFKKYKKDDPLTAIGEVGNWWKLDVDGKTGYVSKQYTLPR